MLDKLEKGSVIIRVQTESIRNDGISTILFLCILLSLLPVLLSSTIFPGLVFGGLYPLVAGGMFLIQIIILCFYYFIYTKMVFNKWLFFLAWAFATAQSITLFISALTGIQIDNLDFINIIVRFINVFIFLCIPSGLSVSKKGFISFMSLIVMLGLVACLYNMITNFYEMTKILNINNPYAVNFKSFFVNRNSFAQLLFFSMIANTFLFFSKRSIFSWLSYFIFGINIIATLSRTVTASVGIFLLIFYIVYFRKKVLTQVILCIFVVLLGLFINSSQEISSFLVNMLIREDVGTTSRSSLWWIGLGILNQTNWMFGIGYITSEGAIKDSGSSLHEFHNFYIETLVGGGAVDLLLHLIMFSFILKKVKDIYKNDRETSVIYFSGYMALMFYAFFESISFYSLGYVGSIFTTFFITVPLLYSNSFTVSTRKINGSAEYL